MTFAVNLFGHMLAALIAFAVFTLLWRERQSAPRPLLLLGAGVLSGLAVVTEYPLALAGAILGIYGVLHPQVITRGLAPLAQRAGLYAAGVIAGVLPLLAYNHWAFGSFGKMSYDNAVDRQGFTGHDTLGLNSGGFFGITWPDPRVALELLISPRGLFALTPVVVMGIVGTVLLHRRGMKAEARTIAAIALAFFIYDTGYWLPVRRRLPGPALPDPAAAVPRGRARRGMAAVPRDDARDDGQRGGRDGDRDAHLSADRHREHVAVVGPRRGRGLPAHDPDGLRRRRRLARADAGADRAARRRLARRPRDRHAAGQPRPADRDRGARRLGRCSRSCVAPAFGERKISGVGKTRKGDVDHSGLPWQIVVIAAVTAALALALAVRAERRAGAAVSRGRR